MNLFNYKFSLKNQYLLLNSSELKRSMRHSGTVLDIPNDPPFKIKGMHS